MRAKVEAAELLQAASAELQVKMLTDFSLINENDMKFSNTSLVSFHTLTFSISCIFIHISSVPS